MVNSINIITIVYFTNPLEEDLKRKKLKFISTMNILTVPFCIFIRYLHMYLRRYLRFVCVRARMRAHVQLHGVRPHACHGAHVELREHLCQSTLFEMSSCWLTAPSPQHAGPAYCFNMSSFYFGSGDLNACAALAWQVQCLHGRCFTHCALPSP